MVNSGIKDYEESPKDLFENNLKFRDTEYLDFVKFLIEIELQERDLKEFKHKSPEDHL